MKNKSNILLIDSITNKVVEKFYDENPENKAKEIGEGYREKGDPKLKHIPTPTKKYPNRTIILTPTDYYLMYLK